jgi:dTDP-glucose 4,6-dehydratase
MFDAVEVFRGDLANPEAVSRAMKGQSVVFHLGALIPIPYSYVHPREYITANVEGTMNVLEAARQHQVERVVHTSTSEVYGTAQYVPIDEHHPIHPQSPYAATKVGADQLALSFYHSFEMPIVIVRPFNTYGPRQSARAIIPTVIAQALDRDVIEVGSLTPTRDFLFVEDTARGMVCAGSSSRAHGEVVNLGTGKEVSIRELIDRVRTLTSRNLNVTVNDDRKRPVGSEVNQLIANCIKAQELLNWKPQVEFDDGLGRTIDWIENSLSTFKTSQFNI